MSQLTTPAFSNLIGISYEKMNCWDLARAFYAQVMGLDLKHYVDKELTNRDVKQNLIFSNKGDFHEVTIPKFGDLIVFKVRGFESHIGIWLTSTTMLHSSDPHGSVIDRIARWEKNIVGYFRPND